MNVSPRIEKAERRPRPHRIGLLAIAFVIAAALFDRIATTLVVGTIALLLYETVFRKNPKVIALVISGAISFWAFEQVGRYILRAQFAQFFNEDADHRMKPNAELGINSDGIRCPVEAADFTGDTYNIIFLGDSFTYGYGVDYEDTIPAQVESTLRESDPAVRVRCVNFGWISSSPGPSYRLLTDIGAKYKPKLVVMCLDMTDFHDDLLVLSKIGYWERSPTAYLMMHLGLRKVLIELHESFQLQRLGRVNRSLERPLPNTRFFVTKQPMEQSLLDMAETERNLQRINDYCRDELGAGFVLVMFPRHFQYSTKEAPNNWERWSYEVMGPYVKEPFRWLAGLRARVDYPCHSLLEDFEGTTIFPTCFDDDPHWNPAGNGVAARGIIRILREEGMLGAAGPTQSADDQIDQ